jgi:hypothetical protein
MQSKVGNYSQDSAPYGQYTTQIREAFQEALLVQNVSLNGEKFNMTINITQSDYDSNISAHSVSVPLSLKKISFKITSISSNNAIHGVHSTTFFMPSNGGQVVPSPRQDQMTFKNVEGSLGTWEVDCLLGDITNSFEFIVSSVAAVGEVEKSHSLCVFVTRV